MLFVCKTVLAGPPDQNAEFTRWENREWATKHSMMVCRRHEIQLYDPAESVQLGPDHTPVPPLNPNFAMASQCARAGIRLAIDWDMSTGTRLGGFGASAVRLLSWIAELVPSSATSSLNADTETR